MGRPSLPRLGLDAARWGAAAVVLARLARGRRLAPPLLAAAPGAGTAGVSVVIPARDEAARIGPCLAALRDDPAVGEVVVVDDGSTDGTADLARAGGARVVAATPLPDGWVGKPWALQQGLEAARGELVVALDADTRPRPGLVAALAERLRSEESGGAAGGGAAGGGAAGRRPVLLTAGPRFDCRTAGERLLHPALLATLVLRFGPPGAVGHEPSPARAIANGQCLAFRRGELLEAGGFALAAAHMTDDVALVRALAARGWRIAFADGADVLDVRMYETAAETWREWGRSIAMPDVTSARWQAADLAVVWLVQALPLPRLLARRGDRLDIALLALRLALLPALARSYRARGAAFWLSPLADVPAAGRLTWSAARPRRVWRGRAYPAAAGRAGRSGS